MTATPTKNRRKKLDRRYGDGRAAFIGHIEAIQKWIDDGRTMRSYYDDRAAQLGITYSTFVRHARKLIKRTRSNPNDNNTPAALEKQPNRNTGRDAGSSPAQFRHNADTQNEDDLV